MSATIRQLRSALRRVSRGRPGQGRRYPAELRRAVVRHVLGERERGVSTRATAAALGLSYQTVSLWLARDRARLRPVKVKTTPSTTPSDPPVLKWVTAHGHRIEGLSRDDVVYLLRGLS